MDAYDKGEGAGDLYQIRAAWPRGANKRRYKLAAEHFGLKATRVYQYTKLSQLDERWLGRLDTEEISVKTAVHLCGLRDE